MEIEAFLADSVVSVEGKLYVQGAAWNVLNTTQIPTRHPRIGIGVIVHVPYTATNQLHKFEIYLLDADDNELPLGDAPPEGEQPEGKIRRLGGQFNVGRPPTLQPGDEQLVAMAVNIDGLEFERADAYRFVVELDGSREKFLPFRVHHVVQPGVVAS
ncbi:MAG TPA: hypothetical protein VFU54_00570 [Actinomycetota bacterium]|jgi:hypothetical protein|nr:hypothetical protein [Actinomycetota bacterium]